MTVPGKLRFAPSTSDDGHRLAELRALAMKPSLTALGRYDETRVRARFLDAFSPEITTLVLDEEDLAAFFVLRARTDHLLLDHLYVHPNWQGHGIGARVMAHVVAQSESLDQPVRVTALKDSPANAFYKSHGFREIGEAEFDTFYERPAG